MKTSRKVDFKAIALRVAGVSAGAVGAGFLAKVAPNLNPKIKAGGIVAVGAALPIFMKGNKFIEHIGDGMIAQGANMLVGSFFPTLISGDEDMMEEETYTETVSGDDDGYSANTENLVSGLDISGADDEDDDDERAY